MVPEHSLFQICLPISRASVLEIRNFALPVCCPVNISGSGVSGVQDVIKKMTVNDAKNFQTGI